MCGRSLYIAEVVEMDLIEFSTNEISHITKMQKLKMKISFVP